MTGLCCHTQLLVEKGITTFLIMLALNYDPLALNLKELVLKDWTTVLAFCFFVFYQNK
jgi:hypothetical protein